MRHVLFLLLILAGLCAPLAACNATAAADGDIHVNADASAGDDHATRLAADLAAAQLPATIDTVDPGLMPFVSQVRYYGEADKALAERALVVLQRYRTRAVLVAGEGPGTPGRIDVFVSTQDDDGSGVALQPAWQEEAEPAWPASVTDEAFRVVFDPEDKSKDPMKSAPAAAKAYFAAARQADAIDDARQRCLRYPALPGTAWPADVVAALCEYGNAPVITAAQFADHVARKDVAALDARLAASLARHYQAGAARSELIHREIEALGRADEGTIAAWRALAPGSAFALAAEAAKLANLAWRARGDDIAGNQSPQQLGQMRALAARSVAAAQAAVRIEPKLLPAWVTLIEVAQLTGDDELAATAWREASALDAGSYRVNVARMNALRPRWGGTFSEMDELARALAAKAGERPLLAIVAAMPDAERGRVAADERDHAEMARVALPRLQAVPDPGNLLALGQVYGRWVPDGRWAGIAYLLQASRFGDCGPCIRNELGQDLMGTAGDPAWALVHLEREVRESGDLAAQTLVGRARIQQGRFADAVALLQAVLEKETDKRNRRDTLELLVEASRGAGQVAQAEQYAQQLAREGAQ